MLVFLTVLWVACSAIYTPFAKAADEKNILNYDGGIIFKTEGSFPNDGPCFQVWGRVTSGTFFDKFEREGTDRGTIFRSGKDVVTDFPDHVIVDMILRDFPCTLELHPTKPRHYITPEQMHTLGLSFYWKRGVELRPTQKVIKQYFSMDRITPYALTLQDQLPIQYEWSLQFQVPSAGVPLTDHLVMVFRGPNGTIAARVAARL